MEKCAKFAAEASLGCLTALVEPPVCACGEVGPEAAPGIYRCPRCGRYQGRISIGGAPADSIHLDGLRRELAQRKAQIEDMQARVDAGLGPEPGGDPAPPEEILEWAKSEVQDLNRWISYTAGE